MTPVHTDKCKHAMITHLPENRWRVETLLPTFVAHVERPPGACRIFELELAVRAGVHVDVGGRAADGIEAESDQAQGQKAYVPGRIVPHSSLECLPVAVVEALELRGDVKEEVGGVLEGIRWKSSIYGIQNVQYAVLFNLY